LETINTTCGLATQFNLKVEVCTADCGNGGRLLAIYKRVTAGLGLIEPVAIDAESGAYTTMTLK
jgi:hypothetical protein